MGLYHRNNQFHFLYPSFVVLRVDARILIAPQESNLGVTENLKTAIGLHPVLTKIEPFRFIIS